MFGTFFRLSITIVCAAVFGDLRLAAQQGTPAMDGIFSSSIATLLPDSPSASRVTSTSTTTNKKAPSPDGAFAFLERGNFSCGAGANVQDAAPQGAVAMCGLGFTFIPGVQVEFGGIGPQGGWPRFYISADGYLPLARVTNRWHAEPILIGGYTKMFYNSNDLDFGLGWDHHIDSWTSMVYEVRDYVQFSSTAQHTVMFRMNYVYGGDD